MFQVPRNRKFYKERKDNTITREDDVKLFHFRNESVQWIADFLGKDDEETRGGVLSSLMKIKILLQYVADPGIKTKIIHRVINRIPPPPGGTAILSEYIHYYGYYYQVIVQCLST
jgi:hypothetical protein